MNLVYNSKELVPEAQEKISYRMSAFSKMESWFGSADLQNILVFTWEQPGLKLLEASYPYINIPKDRFNFQSMNHYRMS